MLTVSGTTWALSGKSDYENINGAFWDKALSKERKAWKAARGDYSIPGASFNAPVASSALFSSGRWVEYVWGF